MIRCRIYNNAECLCCDKVEGEMILVGAFVMCKECYKTEFKGTPDQFDLNSVLHDTYLKWLKVYKEKII